MIATLSISILTGFFGTSFYNKFINKYIIIKKYHFHHTFHGLIFLTASIPFLLKQKTFGPIMAGFGLGLIIHHLFSEKNLKLIEKIKI